VIEKIPTLQVLELKHDAKYVVMLDPSMVSMVLKRNLEEILRQMDVNAAVLYVPHDSVKILELKGEKK
jgi:hypothetical protein